MSRRAEWFWRACAELGLRAELDFKLSLPDGTVLHAFACAHDLGAPNGMLLFGSSSELGDKGRAVVERGFGYSVLDEPRADEEFDIDSYREMFRDWGWGGERDEAPSWMR